MRATPSLSTAPSEPTSDSPHLSRTASRTSGLERRSSWTISSLEMTAAPWRAKALSASDFPAPMPPVTATATGLRLGLVAAFLVGVGFGDSPSLIRLRLPARLQLVGLGGRRKVGPRPPVRP